MSATLTKFEVRLPLYRGPDGDGNISAQDQATTAFLTGMAGLTVISQTSDVYQDTNGSVSQYNLVFGLLTLLQATSALALLTTLNAALVASGNPTVVCYSYPVTSQP